MLCSRQRVGAMLEFMRNMRLQRPRPVLTFGVADLAAGRVSEAVASVGRALRAAIREQDDHRDPGSGTPVQPPLQALGERPAPNGDASGSPKRSE
jgi:hypothetical protein